MSELKPCPFCGCEDIRVMRDKEAIIERHRAICFDCSAQIYRGTLEKAIEAWNRRAEVANEKQPIRKQVIRETCGFRCPSCYFDLTILLDAPGAEEPKYCPMCSQELGWTEGGNEDG